MSEPGRTAPSEPSKGRFATTHWSVVLAARDARSGPAREALATLCETYWFPLYAFARRRGATPDQAQDLTQGFFAHLLGAGAFDRVDPSKGRFRSFLLASFRHFLSDQRAREQAQKRGGGHKPISIDAADAEGRYALEPAHDLTPERIYERRWAIGLIERALTRLRERHVRAGKERHFETLKVFLSGETRAVPYADVARELGLSEVAVKVAVHRLRKRFRDALRDEIVQTVSGPEDVDAELRALHEALAP